eukprot:3417375-Pleurochrysis_carterae.AAC.3
MVQQARVRVAMLLAALLLLAATVQCEPSRFAAYGLVRCSHDEASSLIIPAPALSSGLSAHMTLRFRGGELPVGSPKLVAQRSRASLKTQPVIKDLVEAARKNWAQIATYGIAAALLLPVLPSLPPKAANTAVAIAIALIMMAFDTPAEQALLETVVYLVLTDVITIKDALDGFRSEGVVAVGVMCAVAKSVQITGGLQLLAKLLLGNPEGSDSVWTKQMHELSGWVEAGLLCAQCQPLFTRKMYGLLSTGQFGLVNAR